MCKPLVLEENQPTTRRRPLRSSTTGTRCGQPKLRLVANRHGSRVIVYSQRPRRRPGPSGRSAPVRQEGKEGASRLSFRRGGALFSSSLFGLSLTLRGPPVLSIDWWSLRWYNVVLATYRRS